MPSTHQKPNKPNPTISSPSSSPPSETEIYAVAKVAYTKLVSEASLKDQNLRRLVGHANLYDKLLDEYNNCFSSDEESETDSWDGDVEEEDADAYESLARQAYYTTALTGREFSASEKKRKRKPGSEKQRKKAYFQKLDAGRPGGIGRRGEAQREDEELKKSKVLYP
ncbi:hypothetical protein BKA64DRAFT_278034 [Cadophora sp. MPI-SDFR-AT-0126]|nr:hypothetical protein BKA64DRAFT_278034 [Leotiomycetes sp. MPI-SDFR-AT-0126]